MTDNTRSSAKVTDHVRELAGLTGLAIELLDPGINELERRRHVSGGTQDITDRDARSPQWPLQHKCQFGLHTGSRESCRGNVAAAVKEHVIHERGKAGLGGLQGQLQRAAREADLV